MAASEAKSKVERASGLTIFQPRGIFPFTRLPFEMQKEVFQYLLVAEKDEVIRPEIPHGRENPSCYEHQRPIYCYVRPDHHRSTSPLALDCYHKTLETQLLTVSHNINAVAVQVLYGCNHFHFSSASLFNKFTDTISPLGVQSLRYLAIDYPLCRSFLRRLVMGTEILDLQVLELNMKNENKYRKNILRMGRRTTSLRWSTEQGPSAAAERFIDLLEGLKETESVGNNEILFAIKETFDVNTADVREQLVKVANQIESLPSRKRITRVAEYCNVKLTRKRLHAEVRKHWAGDTARFRCWKSSDRTTWKEELGRVILDDSKIRV